MDIKERLELIKQVGEEIVTEDDLKQLLEKKAKIVAYDGFEPSGRIHIAQGLLRSINIEKLFKAEIKFKMLVADWFAFLNNKFEGDIKKIKTAGDYFIEVWKACGLDTSKIEFIKTSEMIKDPAYWELVMKIATLNSVTRVTRCSQIMGRSEKESLQASQIFYPCMQCADIFYLEADITQLGMDQRKVNMLAREVAEKLGYKKPVIVSHHMLLGLGEPPKTDLKGADRGIELKMSKSKPDSAIFMDDSAEDVNRKIRKAYCPEKQITDNPIIEYCKYIIFEKFDVLKIERPEKFGGDIELKSYNDLVRIYESGELFPLDLKNSVAKHINLLLDPVREYFKKNKKAKELMEKVKSFSVTR